MATHLRHKTAKHVADRYRANDTFFLPQSGEIRRKHVFCGVIGDITAQGFIRHIGDRLAKMKSGFSCRIRNEIQERRSLESVNAAGRRPERSQYFILVC